MMYYGDHMSGWGFAFMGLSSLLLWTVLIGGGVVLFRYLDRTRSHPAAPARLPEQILAERYARAEMDDEEYHRRLATLRGSHRSATPLP